MSSTFAFVKLWLMSEASHTRYFLKIIKSGYQVREQHTETQQLLRSFQAPSSGTSGLHWALCGRVTWRVVADGSWRHRVSSAHHRPWPERAPERMSRCWLWVVVCLVSPGTALASSVGGLWWSRSWGAKGRSCGKRWLLGRMNTEINRVFAETLQGKEPKPCVAKKEENGTPAK